MNDEAVGFRRWSSLRLSQRNGLNGLILCIEDAKVVRCIRNESADPGIAANPNEYDVQLATQIARSCRYYLNFVFEFLFFTALIWFVFWPDYPLPVTFSHAPSSHCSRPCFSLPHRGLVTARCAFTVNLQGVAFSTRT